MDPDGVKIHEPASRNTQFSALADTLKERLALIADREWFARDPSGHLGALKSVSERIGRLAADLPAPVDPQLRHYLERCSYDKALAFLIGEPARQHKA